MLSSVFSKPLARAQWSFLWLLEQSAVIQWHFGDCRNADGEGEALDTPRVAFAGGWGAAKTVRFCSASKRLRQMKLCLCPRKK